MQNFAQCLWPSLVDVPCSWYPQLPGDCAALLAVTHNLKEKSFMHCPVNHKLPGTVLKSSEIWMETFLTSQLLYSTGLKKTAQCWQCQCSLLAQADLASWLQWCLNAWMAEHCERTNSWYGLYRAGCCETLFTKQSLTFGGLSLRRMGSWWFLE